MNTTHLGRQAESKVAEYLKQNNFQILEQNWRTRWCEIDLVASKGNIIYFVEVKFRKSSAFGSGLDYITNQKQHQMNFAAEFWVSTNKWSGDYRLAAIEVTGEEFLIGELIDVV